MQSSKHTYLNLIILFQEIYTHLELFSYNAIKARGGIHSYFA